MGGLPLGKNWFGENGLFQTWVSWPQPQWWDSQGQDPAGIIKLGDQTPQSLLFFLDFDTSEGSEETVCHFSVPGGHCPYVLEDRS